MSCTNYSFSKFKLSLGAAGALSILAGLVMIDDSLDNKEYNHHLGTALFILGWIKIAYIVSLDEKDELKCDLFVKRGIPAILTLLSAGFAQSQVKKGGVLNAISGLTPFMLAWILFTTMIIETSSNNIHESKSTLRMLLYGGFAVIAASMLILFYNRKFNFITGKWDGKARTYSMGLPLFTIGWIMVILGIAIC